MSASKIQSTTNYSRFKFMDGNRIVNNARVKKLVRSIKRKDMLAQFPIVCMKNDVGLYIMDGQHRYTAAKQLGKPIHFVETKGLSIADVASTNSAQRGWSPSDFVASYATLGNQDYITLRDFVAEHGLPVTFVAAMLAGRTLERGGNISAHIINGTFHVTTLHFANRVAGALRGIAPFFPASKDRSFVIAIARLLEVKAFSITRFIQRLETQTTKLVKCASWDQYVDLVEEIYNYRARKDDIVSLSIEVKRMLAK